MNGGKAQVGLSAALAAGALFLMMGCSEKSSPPAPPSEGAVAVLAAQTGGEAISPAVRAEAEKIFANRCTPCHGPGGAGDGPASAGLTPRPRNFQDKAWQSSVSDEHIERIISYGGAAVGRSPAMPPNPDLADKPETKALREYIRGLGK
jgi:mono/diheme cytochrome c family protein